MATEAGMELPDAALKIGAAGKWQHFQKDFFYRLVGKVNDYLLANKCFGVLKNNNGKGSKKKTKTETKESR